MERMNDEFVNGVDAGFDLDECSDLALVACALCAAEGDFGAAIGDAVAAGWDKDCNGATVGGLFGLTGSPIPDAWTRPWGGRIGTGTAGLGEVRPDDVVERTATTARSI